jgi:hypothetical protein
MRHLHRSILLLLALVAGTLPAVARDAETASRRAAPQRLTVPITDPSRPLTLHAQIHAGGIVVEAYDGREVQLEITGAPEEPAGPPRSDGMRVITSRGLGVTVEEMDNEVGIRGDFSSRIEKIVIRVPRRTSVGASTVEGGDIVVRGVEGELELQNVNGSITATDVSGSVVAHTTNGSITVSFASIQAGRPMSFVTFDGKLDVTFPPSLKADVRLTAGSGRVYTDFEVELAPVETQIKSERQNGKFQVEFNREVRGRIAGGGPEIYFQSWNGDIFIRKTAR